MNSHATFSKCSLILLVVGNEKVTLLESHISLLARAIQARLHVLLCIPLIFHI